MDELGVLDLARAEDSDVGEWAADHSDFVAGIEARAGLAVLVDLVGHGIAFGDAEAEVIRAAGMRVKRQTERTGARRLRR